MGATVEADLHVDWPPAEVTHDGEYEEPSAEGEAQKARFQSDSKVEVAFRKVEAVARHCALVNSLAAVDGHAQH